MPVQVRQEIEDYFGVFLTGIKYCQRPEADALGARAFIIGDTVCFSHSYESLNTTSSLRLLCHELAHIVQRWLYLRRPTFFDRTGILLDPALEMQADRLAKNFRHGTRQREWSASTLNKVQIIFYWNLIQLQTRGLRNANYLDGGTINPAEPVAPAGYEFSAHNSLNELWDTRDNAFDRAKILLGTGPTARRTYHWWVVDEGIQLGEGLDVSGGILGGANANQRAGRYYDFGRGKLIVEHPYDPNSTISHGVNPPEQSGHFHLCIYPIANTNSMYMPIGLAHGAANPPVANHAAPAVYEWARRFRYEINGGLQGHHVYYQNPA